MKPHLILGSKGVLDNQTPDMGDGDDVLVSTQPNAFQDRNTLLAVLKEVNRDLVAENVHTPVLWLTDGQSARFTLQVLDFVAENDIEEFAYPPHTTTAHAFLDRVFHSWHVIHETEVTNWCKKNPGKPVTKAVFAAVFPAAWKKWKAAIRAKVGITEHGIFPHNTSDAFFVKSNMQEAIKDQEDAKVERETLPVCTPASGTYVTGLVMNTMITLD
ncbi:hypothetical protein CYMTET_54382 [Cymbomonas tetramitiformis]|uniref:Uncharacterized protein n=1 Tax=Cymbomonas tetramitiformis TaxID=36881 RepID=A0AAE0EPE7_9CHLO|nr:hypothetical protein CYMTET_54382 [Cymbomonas tetramitiformis]